MNFYQKVWNKITSTITILYLKYKGVKIGVGCKFYGFPYIKLAEGSKLVIGNRVVFCSNLSCNPTGINHRCVITTTSDKASIKIGDDVGLSGCTISAKGNITIGNEVLIGSNALIIDNDFHAVKTENRRYNDSPQDVKQKDITIEDNVWLGGNSAILKGVKIGINSIVSFGVVVTKEIPSNSIAYGAQVNIRDINE